MKPEKYRRLRRCLRRCERKRMDAFWRNLGGGWVPPFNLRRVRKDKYTPRQLELLELLYNMNIENGRRRLVASGSRQYAHPGELCGCGSRERELQVVDCETCGRILRRCPTCLTVIAAPQACTHHVLPPIPDGY